MTTLPDVTILKQILAFMMRIFVSLFVIKNFLLRALFSFNTLSFSYKTMYNIIRRSHSISTFDRSNSVVKQLHDRYNRNHDYLRISLTERCNLRCTYCMPEEGIKLGERDNNLSLEELKRISRFFVTSCGVNKIRLTGGEPTVDKKLVPMLEYLNGLRKNGLNRLALTTNGLTLSKQCCRFKELGLNMINISLDTLKADRFEMITRRKGWSMVYKGLMDAVETKFDSIKLNCVVVKGFNDDELLDFAAIAESLPIEVRFIEFMPFAGNKWRADRMVSYRQMLEKIQEKFPNLERTPSSRNEVSKVYKDASMVGSIGFISSMSDNFCSGCNRLRITSDGSLKTCLFTRDEMSLRDLIRNGATDRDLLKSIQASLYMKKRQNSGAETLRNETSRPMIKIGG